jgi:hypothetical protein
MLSVENSASNVEAPRVPLLKSTAPAIAAGIEEVRDRAGRIALGTACIYTIPLLLAWLVIVMPLDFFLELPRWGRACFFAAAWIGAGFVVWWWGVRLLLRKQPDDQVALRIERAMPDFRSRYIASVQLARGVADSPSPALVAALLKETTDIARETDFRLVVTTDHLRPWRNGLIIAAVVAAALCLLGGRNTIPLLLRAFLIEQPIPRKTQILGWSGDRTIAIGDDLRLELTAAGDRPVTGSVHMQTPAGAKYQFTLDADPINPSRFLRTLSAVQESFTYSLHLGDNRTPTGRITVRPRPVLVSTAFTQRWPAYTGRPPQPREPGELKLLAGSELVARVKPSVPLRTASMVLLGQDRKTPLQTITLRPDGEHWIGTAKIPVKDLTGLTFQLTDTAGVESQSMAVTPITVIPDQPPEIQITWPLRREELVTSRAVLLVAFEAKDDFGLGGIRLHYAVNWNEGAAFRTLDLDLGGESPRSLIRRFDWSLDRIKPPIQEGDVIDYWFEVRDNNTETGPGVTIIPDHYQARVVTDDEKRADLAARLNDTLRGLNDVKQNQEELSKRLDEMIRINPR